MRLSGQPNDALSELPEAAPTLVVTVVSASPTVDDVSALRDENLCIIRT